MTSPAHIPSPNVVVTAPLSAEARAAFARLEADFAAVKRTFGGSWTTPTAKDDALKALMRITERSVSLRKAMRAS